MLVTAALILIVVIYKYKVFTTLKISNPEIPKVGFEVIF